VTSIHDHVQFLYTFSIFSKNNMYNFILYESWGKIRIAFIFGSMSRDSMTLENRKQVDFDIVVRRSKHTVDIWLVIVNI